MRFSALILAIVGTVSAILEQPTPEEVCQDLTKCLKLDTFYIIAPADKSKAEDGDNVSVDFSIYDPNPDPKLYAADGCHVDWRYGSTDWPKSTHPRVCTRGLFTFYVDLFDTIDKTFYIEGTHTVTLGTEVTTFHARGKVSLDYLACEFTMSKSFRSCYLKEGSEILLVKYTPVEPPKPAV